MGAEVVGGLFDGGKAHGDLEAVESLPAVATAFDGAADVAGDAFVEGLDHILVAGDTCRPGGDAEAVGV